VNGYPYGVAAKGCASIAEGGGLPMRERRRWLQRALDDVLDEGLRRHPDDRELQAQRGRVIRAFSVLGS
jgi:hypothetical protein